MSIDKREKYNIINLQIAKGEVMLNAKSLEIVERERERERERAILLNKVAYISVALNYKKILNKINLKNKDPCYGLRLMYLRI